MNQVNNKRPRSRKQITTIEVLICPICSVDLIPFQYIDIVSGEHFIKTKYICKSRDNCNYEYKE